MFSSFWAKTVLYSCDCSITTCIITPRTCSSLRTSLTSHISGPWDHHYQCENHRGRKHSERCHLVWEDRCLVSIRSRCTSPTRTLRFLLRIGRTAGKPPGAEPDLVLQWKWKGGSDNYWGSTGQQDVTHLGGSKRNLKVGGWGLYGVQTHSDQLELHTVGKSSRGGWEKQLLLRKPPLLQTSLVQIPTFPKTPNTSRWILDTSVSINRCSHKTTSQFCLTTTEENNTHTDDSSGSNKFLFNCKQISRFRIKLKL